MDRFMSLRIRCLLTRFPNVLWMIKILARAPRGWATCACGWTRKLHVWAANNRVTAKRITDINHFIHRSHVHNNGNNTCSTGCRKKYYIFYNFALVIRGAKVVPAREPDWMTTCPTILPVVHEDYLSKASLNPLTAASGSKNTIISNASYIKMANLKKITKQKYYY